MSSKQHPLRLALAGAAILAPTLAFAHTGFGAHGFAHGFLHPLGGIDHILAMVAVGIFAAGLGSRALWALPLTFMAFMAAGGAAGMLGMPLPFVEVGIALSVIALGVALAVGRSWPVSAAMGMVALFAVFHGHAHGTEMPLDASGAAYGAGFVAATALLHLLGIGVGLGIGAAGKARGPRIAQASGTAFALAGLGLLAGVL